MRKALLLLAALAACGCKGHEPTPIPTPEPTVAPTPAPTPTPPSVASCPPLSVFGARVYFCSTANHQLSEDSRGRPLPVVGGTCVVDSTPKFEGGLTCEHNPEVCPCEHPPRFKVLENPGARVVQEGNPFQLTFRQLVAGSYVVRVDPPPPLAGGNSTTVRFEVAK